MFSFFAGLISIGLNGVVRSPPMNSLTFSSVFPNVFIPVDDQKRSLQHRHSQIHTLSL